MTKTPSLRRLQREEGQSALEYMVLMIGLVTVAFVAMHFLFGSGSSHAAHSGPSHPFPWHTALVVGGIAFAVGLALLAAVLVARVVVRRRAVARLTQTTLDAWRRYVDEPGFDGPLTPEEGYEMLVPVKREEVVADARPERVEVRFLASLYRFSDGDWQEADAEVTLDDLSHRTVEGRAAKRQDERRTLLSRLVGWRSPSSAYPSEREFVAMEEGLQLVWPGDTEIATLAAAWFDFCERVKTLNRRRWAALSDERLEDEARKEELARQLENAQLLSGKTTYDEIAAAVKQARPAAEARQ